MILLKVGDKAPEFTLVDGDENSVSLSDFIGKKVVLWFYPKASTPGWTVEGKGFRDEFQNFESNNVQIIGVSADPPKRQKKFADKKSFQYPLLSDETHEMLATYEAWGKKKFMGREYMGIFRITYIIDENGLIKHAFEKVSTGSHAKDVIAVLG